MKMDVERLLYNFHRLLSTDYAFFVESEEGADNLDAMGLVATTPPGGVASWKVRNSSKRLPRLCMARPK